jgi:nitrogenase molybdenum-iron protein NifN
MLDTHFLLGQARFAVAADADLLNAFCCLLKDMGAEVVAAVASSRAPLLEQLPIAQVQIGDLDDLERLAHERQAEVVISNSHAAEIARRLELPLLRAGFPLYDRIGAYRRTWIGYQGSRQTLFELANSLLSHSQHDSAPYHSIYSCKPDYRREVSAHGLATASADPVRPH